MIVLDQQYENKTKSLLKVVDYRLEPVNLHDKILAVTYYQDLGQNAVSCAAVTQR